MSFDIIDRQFRRKASIKLECAECCSTTGGVRTRHGLADWPVLCDACAAKAMTAVYS